MPRRPRNQQRSNRTKPKSTQKPWRELTQGTRTRVSLKAQRAMETVVEKVQEIGPFWRGTFSDSWVVQGVGGSTRPGPGIVPRLLVSTKTKDLRNTSNFGYRMFNTAPHALIAMDLEPSTFRPPKNFPNPIKPPVEVGKRPIGESIRGYIEDEGRPTSRITAERDWWIRYAQNGFRKDIAAGAAVSVGALARAIREAQ